jgi:ferredoxin
MIQALVRESSALGLRVTEGCTACGLCEAIAPAVFEVTGAGCRLRPEGPSGWPEFLEEIREAARLCPSGSISWDADPGPW